MLKPDAACLGERPKNWRDLEREERLSMWREIHGEPLGELLAMEVWAHPPRVGEAVEVRDEDASVVYMADVLSVDSDLFVIELGRH